MHGSESSAECIFAEMSTRRPSFNDNERVKLSQERISLQKKSDNLLSYQFHLEFSIEQTIRKTKIPTLKRTIVFLFLSIIVATPVRIILTMPIITYRPSGTTNLVHMLSRIGHTNPLPGCPPLKWRQLPPIPPHLFLSLFTNKTHHPYPNEGILPSFHIDIV